MTLLLLLSDDDEGSPGEGSSVTMRQNTARARPKRRTAVPASTSDRQSKNEGR